MKKLLLFLLISLVSLFLMKCGTNEIRKQPSNPDNPVSLGDSVMYNQYLETGRNAVTATGAALLKNLLEAIEQKGTAYAIEFCNIKAQPLTDSMSNANASKIKRVSDNPRNPLNKANVEELSLIQQMKSMLASGEKPVPKLIEDKEKVTGYYPIITNDPCMKCHGEKATIEKNVLEKIATLYPTDSAMGYKPNQLRGLWVVEMLKEK